jgi:hypothetical protein
MQLFAQHDGRTPMVYVGIDRGGSQHQLCVLESVLHSHPERGDITFWILAPAAILAERKAAFERQVAGRAGLRAGHPTRQVYEIESEV